MVELYPRSIVDPSGCIVQLPTLREYLREVRRLEDRIPVLRHEGLVPETGDQPVILPGVVLRPESGVETTDRTLAEDVLVVHRERFTEGTLPGGGGSDHLYP